MDKNERTSGTWVLCGYSGSGISHHSTQKYRTRRSTQIAAHTVWKECDGPDPRRPHPVIVSSGGNTDTSTRKGVRAVLTDLFRLAMTRCVIFLELAVLASALSHGDRWHRDEWRPWSGWSPCGRSCGGGMKYRERQCLPNRYDGERTCMGQTRDYIMCNTQPCPGGTPDYRAEQCAKYNDEHLGGKKYKWIPFYGAANKCELNCMPEERNFFHRWDEKVADGTHCEPGQRDVCVQGTCRAFGCNGQLGSDMAEDKCRVCGGDGSSCVPFISAFNKPEIPRGYNQILVIPAGATSINIKEAIPSKNYLALKSPQGVYFLNGQWTIQYSQPLFVAGTVIHYIRDDQQHNIPQQLIAPGPTTEPLVVELLGLESNHGIHFEYYLPREAQLNIQKGIWSHGSWTECSAHCGEGVQTRTVYCTKDNEVTQDYFCSRAQPANIQNCNMHPCPHRMRLFHRHMPKKWPVEMCDEAAAYRWHISAWGPCSASCGSGRKTRSVSCHLQASDHRSAEALDRSLCVTALGPRPHIEEQCSVHPCPNWVTGSWSECSAECGPGQQMRDVTCNDVQRCDERQHPARTRSCNNGPCVMAQWVSDSWSDCSVMCGEGTQTRRVYCGIRHGSGSEATQDYHCRGDRPAVTQRCQLAPCRETNSWFNGPWGQCSASCGGGLHKRRIFCFRQEGVVEDESRCDAYTRPKDTDTCNMQPCPSPQGHGNKLPTKPHQCSETRFGCCPDSVTAASGPSFQGCRYQAGNGKPYACSLPYSAGSCNDWIAKWYSIPESKHCNLFWYGGCGGNDNRFDSEEECLRACITGGGHSKERSDNKEEREVQNNSSKINYSIRFVKTNGTTIHARPGQPILLYCWSSSDSSATIDWTKDGYPVVDSRYKFFSNGTLKISPVHQSDEGKFTCKVTTARGQKFVNIELRVKGNVWIKLLPADQEVDANSRVEMPCTPSHEQASVQWTKNTLPVLSLPNKVEIQRDGTLVLMSVQPIDGGMYECTVQLGPNWDSAKAKLVVTPSRRTVFPHWAQRVRRSKRRHHKVMS